MNCTGIFVTSVDKILKDEAASGANRLVRLEGH